MTKLNIIQFTYILLLKFQKELHLVNYHNNTIESYQDRHPNQTPQNSHT